MYKITKTDGADIGYTDSVIYIKIASNGCFVQADKQNAIGVAYAGTPYNLFGHNEIPGVDEVMVVEQDGGQKIGTVELMNADLTETAVNLLYELDQLKLGVTEA